MTATMHPAGDLAILGERGAPREMAVTDDTRVLPISVRMSNGHAPEEIFAPPAIDDPASVLALLLEIDAKPVMFALKIRDLINRVDALEANQQIHRDHLETLENRLSGLSSRVGA